MTEPEKDLDLAQIAEAMGMSIRWIRRELHPNSGNNIEHRRLGTGSRARIRMSHAQLEAFKARYNVEAIPRSVTTGRKRSA